MATDCFVTWVDRGRLELPTSSLSGLLRELAHMRQARSRWLLRCPGLTVTTLGRPPDRARGGHDLLIRRFLCGWPDPFRSVRGLGRFPARRSLESEFRRGCSCGWLPVWLPGRHVHGAGGRHPNLTKCALDLRGPPTRGSFRLDHSASVPDHRMGTGFWAGAWPRICGRSEPGGHQPRPPASRAPEPRPRRSATRPKINSAHYSRNRVRHTDSIDPRACATRVRSVA